MADDREQKIRDVYEAMYRARNNPDSGMLPDAQRQLQNQARAAVDVLDPVKRIELSGGFHAEPPAGPLGCYRLYDGKGTVAPISKAAVEAWAAAAQEAKAIGACVDIELRQEIVRLEAENRKLAASIFRFSAQIMQALDAPGADEA